MTSREALIVHMDSRKILEAFDLLLPPLTVLEYLGYRTRDLYRKEIMSFDVNSSLPERLNSVLKLAHAYFESLNSISLECLNTRINLERKYLLKDDIALGIFDSIEKRVNEEYFKLYLVECLKLDYLMGLDDFGDPPPGWKAPNPIIAKLAPRRQLLASAEHSLLRHAFIQREKHNVPFSPMRRLNSIAQYLLRDDIWIERHGKRVSVKSVVSFGGFDNGGDVEAADFAILGWKGSPVLSFTRDDPLETSTRVLIYKDLYERFFEMLQKDASGGECYAAVDGELNFICCNTSQISTKVVSNIHDFLPAVISDGTLEGRN